ncbi:LpqN/LpqT family lipoprotein [Mycolicibacterium arenosum]|uniref:LpqN/LpqT family lipoprotein n=1 Tax=Mycolicibacterium arenosum TaxID=2952157 RepID=A0ABT1M6Z0_9MYCO|nr:LpqN/LpqT family lipoprotein [Mycolicibacterium sp. CAU 1645]MCP9274930.1 LpqN/LpqT family lipoprotein [Mycolicibacterium sp. CAU 1645]
MFENPRRWRLVAGGVAAGLAGVVGFAGTTASAEPVAPQPPLPAPATVTQTVTVQAAAPGLSPQQPAATPASLPAAGALTPAAPAAPAAPTIVPATSQSIAEFLRSKNVAMEPQKAPGFTALNIVLPMPTGWSHVPDPNVPDAFAVIADRVGGDGLYTSNAALVVYKLVGDFDPKEAISHGFIDSQQQPAWRATDGSLADFYSMPSAIIEGTYRQNNMTLNSSRRHVIAQSGPDRYLVTLTVTTSAQVSVASGDATDAIVRGFRVGSPTAAPPAAPPAAAPVPAAPAASTAPSPGLGAQPVNRLLGLPN